MSARKNLEIALDKAGYFEDINYFMMVLENKDEFIFIAFDDGEEEYYVSAFLKKENEYLDGKKCEGNLEKCLSWLVENNYA